MANKEKLHAGGREKFLLFLDFYEAVKDPNGSNNVYTISIK